MIPLKAAAFLIIFISGAYRSASQLTFTVNPVNLLENNVPNEEISVASGLGSTYEILGRVPFQIDPSSGAITTIRVFDYETETRRTYTMTVLSKDGISEKDRGVLIVNILNENEPPVCVGNNFLKKQVAIYISENTPVFTEIYNVSATDEDRDPLNYTLQSQISGPTRDGNFFNVDSTTGAVYISSSSPLDFDAGYEEFRLLIRVTDPGRKYCEGGIIIRVLDYDDEPPIFVTITNDTVYVPENTLPGAILEVFTATDRDVTSTVVYTFPGSISMFSLNRVTGALVLRQPLDYDNPDEHKAFSLSITASDGTHDTNYHFNVNIEDVDEPPICDPAISTGTGIFLSVPETFPTQTPLYTILAKDPDKDDYVKFEISSSSPELHTYFNLDANTGIISTTDNPLDYESSAKKFAIAIKAVNTRVNNPMSCTGLITITVLNENDEAPIFQNLPNKAIEVPENLASGTVVFTLRALDRDIGDSVHYELSSSYNGYFIDEDSGEIKMSYPLDYEDPSIAREQRLRVHAFDNDRVHVTEAEILLKLKDVNDNYPRCDGYPNVVEVAETIAVGTPLIEIVCRDRDLEPPNNILSYKMNPLDVFSVNKFTLTHNRITIGPNPLDYDSVAFAGMQFKHTLQIEVSDSGTPSLTSTVTVIVRVTRVNEAEPEPLVNVFSVQENSPVDSLVGKVNFRDIDWPFNNMKFTFAGGDFGNPPKFYIEPDTGVIKILNPPDFEMKSHYSVTVQAVDLNNDDQPDPLKQLRRLAAVTINIMNVNDEAPVCSPAYHEMIIYSTIKEPFLSLKCSDKDSPADQLSYTIVSGNTLNRFHLQRKDADPPSLATNQNFQYDVFGGIQDPNVFQLLIEVTDEFGGNKALQMSTTATVIVHVVPWTTTVPTIPPVPSSTTVTTSVLVRTSYFWHPDNWFPAVITITAFLFLLFLYSLAWAFLKDVPKYARFFPFCKGVGNHHQPPIPEETKPNFAKTQDSPNNQQPTENPNILPGNPNVPLFYDGRAIDPVSGNHFLFNSQTGDMRWLH